MFRLTIFLALLLSVTAMTLSDINYSFDIDFHKDFDSKRCDNKSVWQLVKYRALNIDPPFPDSEKGIQALRNSCTSSFPIHFFGGILKINVFIRASSRKFNIVVEAFEENDTSISRYVYGRSSEGFAPGWRTISLSITKYVKGYIQLRGRSIDNELVIIDSFRYASSNTKVENSGKTKRSVTYEGEVKTDNTYNYELISDHDENKTETSRNSSSISVKRSDINGVSGLEGISSHRTESAKIPNKESQPQQKIFWNKFSIFLLSLAIVTVALIVGVSAYYCGKIRAVANLDSSLPPIIIDDLEPARTIIIPRVTGPFEDISTFQ